MKLARSLLIGCVVAGLCSYQSVSAEAEAGSSGFRPVKRPFLFMNTAEIAAARKRLAEAPWAEQAYQDSLPGRRNRRELIEGLFNYLVKGDEKAGERMVGALKGFAGDKKMWEIEKTKPWHDRMEFALMYDAVYGRLDPEARARVEKVFRRHIDYILFAYWRGPRKEVAVYPRKSEFFPEPHPDRKEYDRLNWLPNMLYPRTQGVFMMALALQDEQLIRELYETRAAGIRWFFDEYLADGRFYMEEFGKMYSCVGELLLWCRGCERLGLDELGFGHKCRTGGYSMRRFLESWHEIGLPAGPAPAGGTPSFRHVHMGDAGASMMVVGYGAGGKGGCGRWMTARMNGPAPRMIAPLWFEIAHKRWRDARFDWLLARMHKPGASKYYPSLFFDLDPIEVSKTAPPPVRSFASRERGFGMLKMEESPKYWYSDRPVVVQQFAMRYVHYMHASFTMLHYLSHGGEVYGGRRVWRGNYDGGDPWIDTARGRNGVIVDSLQPQPVDDGTEGNKHVDFRERFAEHAKFLAIHSAPWSVTVKNAETKQVKTVTTALYPDVTMERSLFLTDQYLLEVVDGSSDRPRVYHWNYHPYGAPVTAEAEKWQPSKDLDGGKIHDMVSPKIHGRDAMKAGKLDFPNLHKRVMGDADWSFTTRREDGRGVRIHMLGEADTVVYYDTDQKITTTIVQREKPATAYVALHEPFKGEKLYVKSFERIAQDDKGVAVRIAGLPNSGVNDRILLAFWAGAREPIKLADERESFEFTGDAHIRLDGKRVLVSGDVKSMRLAVGAAKPRLLINGKQAAARVESGLLIYAAPAAGE